MAEKTLKVNQANYDRIRRISEQSGEGLQSVTDLMLGEAVDKFLAGVDKLAANIEEVKGMGALVSAPGTEPGTEPGTKAGASVSAEGQLANLNAENDEAEAESEAGEKTPGLATPFDENEDGGKGRWVGLGLLAVLFLAGLAKAGNQRQDYSNRGVM